MGARLPERSAIGRQGESAERSARRGDFTEASVLQVDCVYPLIPLVGSGFRGRGGDEAIARQPFDLADALARLAGENR